MKKILMILSSHEDMENTDSKTGVWLGEFTDPFYVFLDNGFDVLLASPRGGQPPVDPMSRLTEHITASNRRFEDDAVAREAFRHTKKLAEIDTAPFHAVFFPGGHGPLWDLASDPLCGQLVLDFLDTKRPVAAVCHGPAALIAADQRRPGVLSGRRLVSFTNTEETLSLRADKVPYLLETRLKELGADFHAALVPFTAHVEVDDLLITGQNPLSAGPAARKLAEMLGPLPPA